MLGVSEESDEHVFAGQLDIVSLTQDDGESCLHV
jgi:hypothetical protein